MITDVDSARLVTQELRERVAGFVNDHVDLWVTAEDDGILVLAGQDPVVLFQAAAQWLGEDLAYTVTDVRWQRQAAEPTHTLRLVLRHPLAAPEAAR